MFNRLLLVGIFLVFGTFSGFALDEGLVQLTHVKASDATLDRGYRLLRQFDNESDERLDFNAITSIETREEFERQVEKSYKDNGSIGFYIISYDNKDLGLITIENNPTIIPGLNKDIVEIYISILEQAPKGLRTESLRKLVNQLDSQLSDGLTIKNYNQWSDQYGKAYETNHIYAMIEPENIASMISFTRAGFRVKVHHRNDDYESNDIALEYPGSEDTAENSKAIEFQELLYLLDNKDTRPEAFKRIIELSR